MGEITNYNFRDKEIRIELNEAGDPLFVAKDVVLALGLEWKGGYQLTKIIDEWKGVRKFGSQDFPPNFPRSPVLPKAATDYPKVADDSEILF